MPRLKSILCPIDFSEFSVKEGLDDLAPQDDKDLSKAEGAILIAQLLGLLLTFVGEGITLRLVQNVWPKSAFNDRDSEQEKKA